MNEYEGLTEALTDDDLAQVTGGNSDPEDPIPGPHASK